ncbi:MAG TPA: Ig-like domain-containing protein [Allosphingosinicella sp.]
MGGWDEIIKGSNGDDTISGGSGDDFLQGRAGGDFIDGGDGNDQIQGNEGDDYLRGGAGNDYLHGGLGTDTAVYSGSILEYSFSRDGENFYVSHSGGTGIDGNDHLISIERLVFADATIDLTQNNAPIAFDDAASTDEDVGTFSSGSTSVLDNDFDWEGDSMSVTPGTFNGVYGTLTLNADGTYTYTPYASTQSLDDGETVQDSFSYTVSDGSLSDTGTLTITIGGLNDAPVAVDDAAAITEDASVSGNVLANDTDVDNETLTVANPGVYVGAYGTLTLAADGSYTYTPSAAAQALDDGETVQDSFSYTASDGTASDSATLTVTVAGANDAPVAVDDAAATTEEASVSGNVLANDTDVDGETLTVTNPGTYVGAYGTLTLAADGSYTYTPSAAAQALDDGETVQDSFSYTASDGTASDSATLTVTVAGANDAPVAVDDAAATTEDASVSGNVLANDTDVDNETLTVTNPGTYVGAYGTLTLAADGSYTYTPNAAANGLATGQVAQDAFAYTASDGTASDTATLTVTVTGANDAPTIDAGGTSATGSVTELPNGDPGEGTTVHEADGTVAFDDVDLSDTHSATATPQGGGYYGTFTLDPVNQAGDTVAWHFDVSDADIDGLEEGEVVTQTYTITIDDGHGGTATQDVTITITGAADSVPPDGTNWYIDNSAVDSANTGSPTDPFTSIAAFNAAQGTPGGPGTGDNVYLLTGTGSGVYAEADGINLLDGQTLTGVATGALRPTIVTTGGDGINVAQGNTVTSIDIGTTSGAGIADSGGTVGTLTVSDVAKSGGGQIVDIDQGGTVSITLNSAASTGSAGGAIDLNGLSGSFTVTGATTIAGHTGGGIDITASSGLAASFQGNLVVVAGSTDAIRFDMNANSSLTLSGAVKDINATGFGADGLLFTNNSGTSALAITGGGLDIDVTAGIGLSVQTGGSVTVTGAGNSVTSTTGSAVIIRNATSNGVTLESVSSSGGNAAGIILDNAGSGGFTVTGLGSVAGSGGTITNKNGADGSLTQGIGVTITNAANVSLSNMAITTTQNFGILGNNVNNFTLRDSTVTATHGTTATATIHEGAVNFTNLSGNALFEGNTISGGRADNLRIVNNSGSLNLTIRDSASDQAVFGLNNLNGNDSVYVETSASAALTMLVDGVSFLGARGDLLQVSAQGTSTQNITIQNSSFANTHTNTLSGGGGLALGGGGAGSNIIVDYRIEDSTFTGARGPAINTVYTPVAGTIRGLISGNVVGLNDGTAGSQGSSAGGSGILAGLEKIAGAGSASYTVTIDDNEIYDVLLGLGGIELRSNGGGAANPATLEATVTNNIVDDMGDFAIAALYAMVGGSALNGDFARLGLELSDNILNNGDSSSGMNAIYLDQVSNDAHYYFPGYAGDDDGENFGGTASVDLNAFFLGKGNVMVNGGGPSFPLIGVDASFISDATGDPFIHPVWP